MAAPAPKPSAATATKPAAARAAPPPSGPPAAAVAPKGAGVVRVGVVKIKDVSGQGLPTDNLRLNLMDEIAHRQMEAVPLGRQRGTRDAPSAHALRALHIPTHPTAAPAHPEPSPCPAQSPP